MAKIRVLIYIVFIIPFQGYAQTFPKLGNDTLLDIACWNLEWFGDISYGPTDETTQYNNVKALMMQTEFDLLALEEISNINTYNTLSNEVSSKYETYISTFSATQKMGLFWRKSMFDVIGVNTLNVLPSQSYNFGTRPPLQVCLKTKGGSKTDTLFIIVVHMKAQTESTDAGRLESYNRRMNAAGALKTYVEQNLVGKKFLILGDWNDDLSVSIYNGITTPYKSLLDAAYTFPSKELSDVGKKSYAFGTAMIDHILQSKTLDSFYFKNSARVFDDAGTYVSNFSNNTSDHFPVYAFYNWKKLTTIQIPAGIENLTGNSSVSVYPNPANSFVHIQSDLPVYSCKVYDQCGRLILQVPQSDFDVSNLKEGFYQLQVETESGSYAVKFIKGN